MQKIEMTGTTSHKEQRIYRQLKTTEAWLKNAPMPSGEDTTIDNLHAKAIREKCELVDWLKKQLLEFANETKHPLLQTWD